MTPLEAAAKAYIVSGLGSRYWDAIDDASRKVCIRDMRAALLALAECDLSEEMIDLGWEDDQGTPDFDRDFTALLRSIATEGKDV